MKQIDVLTWERREAYDFFSQLKDPFWTASFTLDITEARQYARWHGCSLYLVLVWTLSNAVNKVENLRYAIKDGKPVLLDRRYPSYTDLHENSTQFHIVTVHENLDLPSFLQYASMHSNAQNTFMEMDKEGNDLIYLSCLPWLDLTHVESEGPEDKDDAVPRLTWGRYREENQRVYITLSMSVNHRFADGIHLAMFQNAFHQEMQDLLH